MNFVYLGYGRYDAATNLALDEAALNAAERNQRSYVRFYDFERPAVILSRRQGKYDVRSEKCKELGIDVSRRLSGGTAILCDENTLAYSIASPFYAPDNAHKYFGQKIAGMLKDLGIENITIGEHFSVRINGGTVAGHGQRYRPGRSLLYHGVIAVEPWNHVLINEVIALRPPAEEGGISEYDLVKQLPAINHHVQIDKKTIAAILLKSFTNGQYETSDIHVLYPEAEELKRDKYTSDLWIREGEGTGEWKADNLGFCFIARKEPQHTFY